MILLTSRVWGQQFPSKETSPLWNMAYSVSWIRNGISILTQSKRTLSTIPSRTSLFLYSLLSSRQQSAAPAEWKYFSISASAFNLAHLLSSQVTFQPAMIRLSRHLNSFPATPKGSTFAAPSKKATSFFSSSARYAFTALRYSASRSTSDLMLT